MDARDCLLHTPTILMGGALGERAQVGIASLY